MEIAIPDDIRQDLLRQQQQSIETPQQLPRIEVMPAGVGLFEFKDDNSTVREFEAVILNNHPTNTLWDKKYGSVGADAQDEDKQPACASPDGRYGLVRRGFAHAGLPAGMVGNGAMMVECGTCPYNKFGSGALLIADRNPKGKACTNYRSVYVMLPDHDSPLELRLPPTSIGNFDAYLTMLMNTGTPVQAVLTKIVCTVVQKTVRYSTVTFTKERALTPQDFQQVLDKRSRYWSAITPMAIQTTQVAPAAPENDDDMPF
jgi:hypothetical protein